MIALTASLYDGYLLKLDEVLPLLVKASPSTAIMIDSAWTAVHTFGAVVKKHTAFAAVENMRAAGTEMPPIIVTTSVHKTLCSLRQGSLILVANGAECVSSLQSAIFMHHTTSPSWTILASLDLACGHASEHAKDLFAQAVAHRNRFVQCLKADPLLAELMRYGDMPFGDLPMMIHDPVKVLISAHSLGDPHQVRRILYGEHGIYVARCNGAGLLLNFTIGISSDDVDALLSALKCIIRCKNKRHHSADSKFLPLGSVVTEYVVPYPPGIPIAQPGDIWTSSHTQALNTEIAAGAEIFRLPEFSLERTRS